MTQRSDKAIQYEGTECAHCDKTADFYVDGIPVCNNCLSTVI